MSGGATLHVGAQGYETPSDWRWSPTLFSATDPGSLLDLAAMKSIAVHYGAYGANTYSVTVNSNAVIDLSGLQTMTGPEEGDDWLAFIVQNGGALRLNSLRQATRQIRFSIQVSQFDLPALDAAEGTAFSLADGTRLNAPNLTRLTGCSFSFGFNSTLNAPMLGSFQDTTLALSPGVIVNAPPFTNVYAARFSVSDGTTLHIGAPSYDTPGDWRWSPTLFSADGNGSLLDLSQITAINVPGGHGGAWTYTVAANNNGGVDLSSLVNVQGCRTDTYGNDDWLVFNLRNGGDIRLGALRQITGKTRFNLEVPLFQLPALDTAESTAFILADNSRIDLPGVRGLSGSAATLGLNSTFNAPDLLHWSASSITFGLNSTCNVPNLLNYVNSDLALSPGKTFTAPAFTNIYASRLAVSGGSTLRVAAPDYDHYNDWRWSPTLFSADGTGSLLDLAAMKTLQIRTGYYGSYTYSITANNNGVIDLSGLDTVVGAEENDDVLAFNVQNGGRIRLDALRHVTRYTRFNLQVPQFDLPALQSAELTAFVLADNTRLSLTNLASLDSCSFTFGFNNTIDAPRLLTFTKTALTLSPGRTLNAPPFTNIYGSRLAVSGGSVLRLAAPAYDIWGDWRTSATLFSADGAGSLLDMATMKTLTVPGAWGGAFNYSVTANNGGLVDLSGLENIVGTRSDVYDNDDWLRFSADTAGAIRLGFASVARRAQFAATGTGTRIEFAGLYFRPPSTLNVNTRASLDIKGDFFFENTDPNSIVVEGAALRMDGTQPQVLEAGGKNLGPAGASSRNFGYSQLQVGSSNRMSVVQLQDRINNGQRGPSGESEALYLYGLDGQGLRLLNNSRLIVGTVPVYAYMGGQMRQLNSLFTSGTNSLAFDGGFIAGAGGPKITQLTPNETVMPPVSSVDVTFDIPIKLTTFTIADVTITGPGGSIPLINVLPVADNTYRISFAPQRANGVYTVRLGPAIDELAGNLNGMDQNGNGSSGETEDEFTGAFAIDGIAPVIVGAMALQNGTRVGVTFDEPVSPAFATNPANYLINGSLPTQAVQLTNGSQVALYFSGLVGESFTLDANHLADTLGNTTNRTFTGSILPLEPRDIGNPGSDPRETGATVTFTGSDFDSVGGGSAIWANSDACHFVSERRTGDFDVRVQVTRMTRTGPYADGGLMARESLAGNSRKIQAVVQLLQNGGAYFLGIRYDSGGNVPSPYPHLPGVDTGSAGIPDAWIRLRRQGTVFSSFRSTNGTDWIEYGRVTNDFPATTYLGLVTAALNNNAGQAITASYRNYTDITPSILSQPQGQAVASGAAVAFAVTARGLPTLDYQWFFNGSVIGGATNNLLTLTSVTTNNVGDFRVVVTNPYGATTSLVATLVVDGVGGGGFEADVAPPPYGNNSVSVSDWVRVGRLVAGLESVLSSSEFQRADCAPRTNALVGTLPLGDGRLTVADWTQAGRYAAGLDPLTPAGGTNQPASSIGVSGLRHSMVRSAGIGSRRVWVSEAKAAPGQPFAVWVNLLGEGDENAVGFSLGFDAARLAYQDAKPGQDAPGSVLQVNATQAGIGKLGLALAKPAGQSFSVGKNTLVEVWFTALTDSGVAVVSLADTPVLREIASFTAEVQPADYQDGLVRLMKAPRLIPHVQFSGGRPELNFSGEAGQTYAVHVSTDLTHWQWLATVPVPVGGSIIINDPTTGQSRQRFYRAMLQP